MASISTCFISATKPRHSSFNPPSLLPQSRSRPALFPLPSSPRLRPRAPSHRVSASPPVFRAGLNVPQGLKPGSGVETDKIPVNVRNQAMEAVDSFGGRVTIGDVASKGGIKTKEAERALQALAADTGGFLEVSDEGDVLYVFPKDYRSRLVARSFRMKIEPFLDKLKLGTEYLIRVSFGTALVVSILVVYTAIIALISSKSDDDNRGRRGGRSFSSDFTYFFRPSDIFWFWDPYYYRKRQRQTDDGMNFIESVFSFVFGDGDPNQGLEEKRWKLIGQYITSNGGVVTAEELAPYLDVLHTEETVDDESYILPVLLRFDGHPEVDDEGNILYRFRSLQRTASSKRVGGKKYDGKSWMDGVNNYLEEKKWPFSKAGEQQKALVLGLGTLNLCGVITLGTMLKTVAVTPGGFISFVSDIFPLLQIYAAAFFAIPLFRWFLLRKTNADIERRNLARQQRARALEFPNSSLRNKILSARDMAQRTVIRSDKIVYSTERDIADQDLEATEWEQRFRELERSD